MEIRIGSWLYNFWQFTFDISRIFEGVSQPSKTTRKQFKLRILQMLFPVLVILAVSTLLWLSISILCNIVTILSGSGVYVTWSGPDYYLKDFRPSPARFTLRTSFFEFDKTVWIIPQVMAAVFWIVGLVSFAWYITTYTTFFHQYLDQMIVFHLSSLWNILGQLSAVVFYFAVMVVIAFGFMKYSDKSEAANQRYVRGIVYEAMETNSPLPKEIITFVDPRYDDTSLGV